MIGPSNLHVQLITKPGSRATGIGRYAHEIEIGLRGAGVDVTTAGLRNPIPGPFVRAVGKAGYDLDAFSRSYPLRADTEKGRITHFTSQTLATLLLTQRLTRPVIVTVHDILPYLLRDDPELSVYRHRLDRLMDSLAMRGLKRADRLIADSAFTKQTLIDTLRIPATRIDVVHLGINSNTFRPQKVTKEFLERHRLPTDKRYVLFVGSEDPRKDLPTLLRAMAIVRGAANEVELIKVGAPAFADQRKRHIELCQELGIQTAVHWIDAVSEEDLPLFYNLASVFAFPSRYEGFGFPVLEAMACGTPVVAANASSVPELTGSFATLVPPQDPEAMASAIIATMSNSMIDRGALVQHASSFTWEHTVTDTIQIYGHADAHVRENRKQAFAGLRQVIARNVSGK
jgi:glycosyltransferase involved in cell wall biosynthesis